MYTWEQNGKVTVCVHLPLLLIPKVWGSVYSLQPWVRVLVALHPHQDFWFLPNWQVWTSISLWLKWAFQWLLLRLNMFMSCLPSFLYTCIFFTYIFSIRLLLIHKRAPPYLHSGTNPLFIMCCKYFSQFVACFFTILIASFDEQKQSKPVGKLIIKVQYCFVFLFFRGKKCIRWNAQPCFQFNKLR